MLIPRLPLLLLSTLAALPLRAASAPPDTLEQRLAACNACHSRPQRADAYFPRIAGKPAGYLYHQLQNFRDGRRTYPLMTYMVGHLPDAYLREIAEYYSQQHPPYPPAAPGSAASASPAALERGRRLVREGDPGLRVPACAACHGASLNGVAPAIPGLLGLPSDYINAQLGAWKNGLRKAHAPDCMAAIATRLTPADVAAVSAWLSGQPPDAEARPQAAPAQPLPLDCGSVRAP
jgi:cytochrome c553